MCQSCLRHDHPAVRAEGRCAPTQARFLATQSEDDEPRGLFGLEAATLRLTVIVVGSVLGFLQLAIALFCCWRRRRSRRLEQTLDSPSATQQLHP